jgi:hypothetical protein
LSFSKGVFVETGRLQIRETHDSEHSVRSTEDDIALLDIVKGEEEGESSREHIFLELDGVRKEWPVGRRSRESIREGADKGMRTSRVRNCNGSRKGRVAEWEETTDRAKVSTGSSSVYSNVPEEGELSSWEANTVYCNEEERSEEERREVGLRFEEL